MPRLAIAVVPVRQAPPCQNLHELFFGPDVDGRTDKERDEREAIAKGICTGCAYRWGCLEQTAIFEFTHAANGVFGVAGGMSEGERQRFYVHLRSEGYDDVPYGLEFVASITQFYRAEVKRKLRRVA